MARSVYVASAEGETGKGAVALGLLDLLTRRVGHVGVFRPIVRPGDRPDYVLELLLDHDGVDLPYELCAGVTYDDVHNDPDGAMSVIVERYHEVARDCAAMVVVGSDHTDVGSPTEFSFNARIAVNLDAPVLLVVPGRRREPGEIRTSADLAIAELAAQFGRLLGIVANRVDPDALGAVREALAGGVPAYAIPDEPLLTAPTVADLLEACDGTLRSGDPAMLGREALDVLVGAMTVPHVLDHLVDGGVVITPSDRSDVLLGVLMAHASQNFPSLAGVFLNGGFEVPAQVERLVDGLEPRLPVVTTSGDTYTTATRLAAAQGRLSKESPRKVDLAMALFDEHVDGDELLRRLDVTPSDVVTPLMFEYALVERARDRRRRIVLPEGEEERILQAAETLLVRGVADLTLLGSPSIVRARADHLGVDVSAARIVDPHDDDMREQFALEYARLRAHKGMTVDAARDVVVDASYFGTMMVLLGLADGMVSGAAHTTAHTIRPAFEVIRTAPGVSVVSSVFFMCLRDRVLVYGDCAVIPDPTAEQLADIAMSSAVTAAQFGVEPRVAMLSYSTGESGVGADVDKVRTATALVRERRPDLSVDGPIQYDAAVDASVARTKLPGSEVAGRATVFVFPDLNTGNNTYKAVQRSAGAVAIGPVLQGLRRPVNDLSRGATVRDIVNTVAITAIQAAENHGE
ncbi:MAG TPA: phosphate acetyltransferase [Jiangellaceae bacterium]|nr:phosphate acetyltransferase [Jiangellaceae bacterium]